ncbi:CRISPR-associated helicase Cas3' [Candidatus Acidulodesulfobacterium sp. H_13]|uniref:CRISPR-associated helicase Cas3' n=1 Tax=Candidatus Acidulodesulfobacterium sp. H_13 TaxID=3395470 RepID=UPI003AF8719E
MHHLEKTIIGLIAEISDDQMIQGLILELFVKSVGSHDFGKINPEFQKQKMQNARPCFKHDLSSGHSLISGYIFSLLSEATAAKKNIPHEKESLIDFLILSFSYPILKHHSSKLDYIKTDIAYKEKLSDLRKFVEFFDYSETPDFIEEIHECVFKESKKIFDRDNNEIKTQFPLFALIKLNYSLLTVSDYYATTHYMDGWKDMANDFGTFNDKLKKKIINNIETTKSYNEKTYKELDNYKFNFPKATNNKNLNRLRQNLSVEIIQGIRNNLNKNLFYIEAPTGGGKTNLSMVALAELLRNDVNESLNNITKVFYVFPFTTLITQTFMALQDTLGLDNDEIVQIHSKTGFSQKGNDDNYGNNKENIIDYQFVNYPVALISHIKFFNILKSNKKNSNYLLHRLANSVVIIDELQAYPPKEWDKIIYFINSYAKYFNIKFILMSATLPKIDKLLSPEARKENFEKEDFVLLNRPEYFMNPNFKNRIEFDFSMLKNSDFNRENREDFLSNLWNKILRESKEYKDKSKSETVHTIIEFIYKQTADEFAKLVNNKKDFFDEIFILSGTILEPRRKEIITKLKSSEYRFKNILLITTQVVEAGVNIDMDIGFKDLSLVDSDEQLAGRINRNFNKSECKLFIFDLDDAKVIYAKDDRYNKIQDEFKSEYYDILKEKTFDKIYNSIMEDRNKINAAPDFINLGEYVRKIGKLDFASVDKDFKIIDDDCRNVSIFVPIDIPIKISNSEEVNFTKEELQFLIDKKKYSKAEPFVIGEKVWDLYCDIIQNRDEDFAVRRMQKVIMQGLIAKFSFSIGIYSKNFKFLSTWSCEGEKYGFYKLNDCGKFYDYYSGIKTLEFKDTNFF